MARSLFPSLLGRDWWNVWDYPPRLFDQYFGLGISEDDLFYPRISQSFVLKPRRKTNQHVETSGISEVINTGDKFQALVDVSHFSPNNISVKTINDCVVIHAKHDEKVDEHGFISREFTRKYVLPKDVNPETVTSSLSSDGILIVEAPKNIDMKSNERIVPIIKRESAPPAEGHNEA